MKKIVVVTSLVSLVMFFLFAGPQRKMETFAESVAINIDPVHVVSTSNNITVQPHEMPASQIKDSLLADLRSESVRTSKEAFYFEHHACSSKLLACLLMANRDHATARKFLEDKGGRLTPQQLQALREHETTREVMKELELLEGQKVGSVAQKLEVMVNVLDVQPLNQHAYKRAGYATYYADKKEDFSLAKQDAWEAKQKNVLKVLQEVKPATVLDLGGNSGWFSRLAATNGARVIATDIDEGCIEYQYQAAKEAHLPVTPIIQAFEKLSDDKEAIRLQSDVVFCLALIHHLVFLNGMKLEEVLEKLAKVTKKTLILEFVDLEDKCIQRAINEPTFFKSNGIHSSAIDLLKDYGYENYNLKTILKLSEKNFFHVKTIDSYPDTTRHLLILSKK